MTSTLVVGDQRLIVDAPSIHLVARPSFYREGQMIGLLDLGRSDVFIVAPVIRLEEGVL
ncbi:MAG TPA: hypothetical protein VOA88_01165 [Candidatus Dormibacteraeota bacterium]|nr:hypothetical protein [Candidatus Dormibacteraeota bacterium]